MVAVDSSRAQTIQARDRLAHTVGSFGVCCGCIWLKGELFLLPHSLSLPLTSMTPVMYTLSYKDKTKMNILTSRTMVADFLLLKIFWRVCVNSWSCPITLCEKFQSTVCFQLPLCACTKVLGCCMPTPRVPKWSGTPLSSPRAVRDYLFLVSKQTTRGLW